MGRVSFRLRHGLRSSPSQDFCPFVRLDDGGFFGLIGDRHDERCDDVAGVHLVADLDVDRDDRARMGRRHVHRRFVGLERDQRFFNRYLIALLHQHLDDIDIGEVAEIGHHEIDLVGRHEPPSRSASTFDSVWHRCVVKRTA